MIRKNVEEERRPAPGRAGGGLPMASFATYSATGTRKNHQKTRRRGHLQSIPRLLVLCHSRRHRPRTHLFWPTMERPSGLLAVGDERPSLAIRWGMTMVGKPLSSLAKAIAE